LPISNDFFFPATDSYPLAARLWASDESASPVKVAVINAGAGIAMRYYDRFAAFLASGGIPTLIYDYRGIARSRPKSLRGFPASVEDWGSKDCAAAVNWLAERFPGAKRVIIGHSVGGLVTGFVTNGPMIDRMLLVAAHTGYWRDYAAGPRIGMYILWHAVMPSLTHIIGYFPGRALRLLEDLPAGVALEWANRRSPELGWDKRTSDGTPDTRWTQEALAGFQSIRAPTLALTFTDDAFATQAATARILGLYQNCEATQIVIEPSDVGGKKIGHFGFFRSRFRDTLWTKVLDWLRSQ